MDTQITRSSVPANGAMALLVAFSLLQPGRGSSPARAATDDPPLTLVQTIPLPGVVGRIDHIAADVAGQRLFVAALGNDSLEVLDLKRGARVRSIHGLREPQGVAFAPDLGRPLRAGAEPALPGGAPPRRAGRGDPRVPRRAVNGGAAQNSAAHPSAPAR